MRWANCRLVTCFAIQEGADVLLAAGRRHNPDAIGKRRLMTHMLPVAASQIRHPVTLLVLMIATDRLFQPAASLCSRGRLRNLHHPSGCMMLRDDGDKLIDGGTPCPLTLPGFNRRDLDGIMALYEPEASLLPQPGQVVHDRDAIRQALRQFLALKATMTMATVFSAQSGDLALLRGHWELAGTGPDGTPVRMSGQSIKVARKQTDGTWLFVIDHPFGAD
jgi:uncharacterized protein (TIGR02246 family)